MYSALSIVISPTLIYGLNATFNCHIMLYIVQISKAADSVVQEMNLEGQYLWFPKFTKTLGLQLLQGFTHLTFKGFCRHTFHNFFCF